MVLPRPDARSRATLAMICSGVVGAQYVAAVATRDALFLTTMDAAMRPAMVTLAGGVSILVLALNWRLMKHLSPAVLVPGAFALSAVLLALDWALVSPFPGLAARAFFLQTNGLGPVLGSGFWLVVSEQFDPRSARKYLGRIAAGNTISGLGGALLAARVADVFGINAMLPVLAVLNVVCGWQLRRLALCAADDHRETTAEDEVRRSSFGELVAAPYIRILAAFVVLGTMSSAFVEHLVNVKAQETLAPGVLPTFFSIYYGSVGLLAFALQTGLGLLAVDKLGLALTMTSPWVAFAAGGLGALFLPGLAAITAAYGAGSVLYESLYRKAYEIFLNPVPKREKRSIKAVVDIAPNRLGVAIGSGVIGLLTVWWPERLYSGLLFATIGCSGLAFVVARHLNHAYIHSLERNLLARAVELDLSDVEDLTTRTVMLRTLRGPRGDSGRQERGSRAVLPAVVGPSSIDPEVAEILALRSRDRERIVAVLHQEEGMPAVLVPHVIPLLAWEPVADDAVYALRKVAEERIGELIDALIDPNQPFAVRRRLARVFSVCVSQRAADGLVLGLEDQRFEVRFQCGRSLATIVEKNPRIRIDSDVIYAVVLREISVGRPVWESHRLLDRLDDLEERSFVDEFLKDRTSQGLAHVFTLLSLVLPSPPIQVAYRGLHTDDPGLRGTALEYLDSVLPPNIRGPLWPFLGEHPVPSRPKRPSEAVLADLMRSNKEILTNLDALRRSGSQT